VYTELAREAIISWKDQKKWDDTYHEYVTELAIQKNKYQKLNSSKRSGVLVLGSSDTEEETSYVSESYRNDVALGAVLERLQNGDQIRSVFPPDIRTATFSDRRGYLNRDGGWANAGQGLSMLLSKVIALKGKVLPGKSVHKILRKNGKTTGVQCTDDSVFDAGLIIIATGSWTASTFPELDLAHMCLATG
jgi:sarcosine oxidase / L-pipecolate oxidase